MLDQNYNYLTCSSDKLAEDYDYKNRPDPDRFSKRLYDDLIEVYFGNLGATNKIQQFRFSGNDAEKNDDKRSSHKYNKTIVMVTHDSNVAAVADMILKMDDGRIIG